MSGYSRTLTAEIVASTAERASRIEGGDVRPAAVHYDYVAGWNAVSHAVRVILSTYVEAGERPPAEEPNALLAEIERRRLTNEATVGLSATVRHVRAVDRLGSAMRYYPQPRDARMAPRYVVATRHHRGLLCLSCSQPVDFGGDIIWDERRGKVWHTSCYDT